jgi:diguanylate cyclase (GGDEF)-like protein
MPRFLISEPAEIVLSALGAALDLVDFAVVLLDPSMRVRFANDRLAKIFALPADFVVTGLNFRALLEQAAAAGWYPVPEADLPAYLNEREAAVLAGSSPPAVIELSGGRSLLFRSRACPDGGRMLTYTDISPESQNAADAAALRLSADMRFNVETMESQGAYLASLAEAAEDNAQRAEAARLLLQAEIAERQQLEIKLRRLATTDGLTGAMNRAELLAVGQRETEISLRSGHDLAVLMLDVDHFKGINDRYGHAGGDCALRHLAALLRAGIRSVDILGRLGGEEFAIVLPATAPWAAERVAERLVAAVAGTTAAFGDTPIAITVSIGLAVRRDADRSIEQIIARADDALYRAKLGGRNQVVTERQVAAA